MQILLIFSLILTKLANVFWAIHQKLRRTINKYPPTSKKKSNNPCPRCVYTKRETSKVSTTCEDFNRSRTSQAVAWPNWLIYIEPFTKMLGERSTNTPPNPQKEKTKLILIGWTVLSNWHKRPFAKVDNLRFDPQVVWSSGHFLVIQKRYDDFEIGSTTNIMIFKTPLWGSGALRVQVLHI